MPILQNLCWRSRKPFVLVFCFFVFRFFNYIRIGVEISIQINIFLTTTFDNPENRFYKILVGDRAIHSTFITFRKPIEIRFRRDWKLDAVSNQGSKADFFRTRFFNQGHYRDQASIKVDTLIEFMQFSKHGRYPDQLYQNYEARSLP